MFIEGIQVRCCRAWELEENLGLPARQLLLVSLCYGGRCSPGCSVELCPLQLPKGLLCFYDFLAVVLVALRCFATSKKEQEGNRITVPDVCQPIQRAH